MSKIEINNIYKIFGTNPDSVMDMVKNGSTKGNSSVKDTTMS